MEKRNREERMQKISFIGIGRLGFPLSLILSKTNKVYLIDNVQPKIDSLKSKISFLDEPITQEYLNKHYDNLNLDNDINSAITETDITFILVNTPLINNEPLSDDQIISAIRGLATPLKNKTTYHQIILCSTVSPGSCNGKFIPLIESLTDKKHGIGFGFSYVPDTVKLGSVVNDFENMKYLWIGAEEQKSYDITEKVYNDFISSTCKIFKLNILECELAKVLMNTYLLTKITFGNLAGNILETFENVNIDSVINAFSEDERIGNMFIKYRGPFGGNCFPRDLLSFRKVSMSAIKDTSFIDVIDKINEFQVTKVIDKLKQNGVKDVCLYGVTFKSNVPVTLNSFTSKFILYGKDYFNITVYDIWNIEKLDNTEILNGITYVNDIDCFSKQCSSLIITLPIYNKDKQIISNLTNCDIIKIV
jgi:nucleotide sugar dehydrogenase